jgi:hypothetical protein
VLAEVHGQLQVGGLELLPPRPRVAAAFAARLVKAHESSIEHSRHYVPARQLQHMPLIDSHYLARWFAGPHFD